MPSCEFCGDTFDTDTGLHLHWSQVHGDALNSHQKKKAKQAEKDHRRSKHAKQQKKAERKKLVGYVAGAVLAIVLIGFGLAQLDVVSFSTGTDTANSGEGLMGESYSIVGRNHVQGEVSPSTYSSNPPTSGPHWPSPAGWGFYSEQLPDERLVHNLEHGGTWISYTENVTEEGVDTLRILADKYPNAVIVTERPENPSPIAVASWGQLMLLQNVDQEKIEQFITTNLNNAPEPLASTAQHTQ